MSSAPNKLYISFDEEGNFSTSTSESYTISLESLPDGKTRVQLKLDPKKTEAKKDIHLLTEMIPVYKQKLADFMKKAVKEEEEE